MKIFNRGNFAPPAGPAAAEQSVTPVAAPHPEPQPQPDVAALLESSVNDISEKVARLASSVEHQQEERASFETKLAMMEERMRKLSSLTEMISSQYNPFVGEAPPEREPLPTPEDAFGVAKPRPTAAPPAPAPAPVQVPVVPAPVVLAPREEPVAAAVVEAWSGEGDVRLVKIEPGFESARLVIRWADTLLRQFSSREQLVELLAYYHNIGWIGDQARDQLLAYAEGLAFTPSSDHADWRLNADLHEHSLLFIEKLRRIGETSDD